MQAEERPGEPPMFASLRAKYGGRLFHLELEELANL